MKGIILAGGTGTRLYPLTKVTSKQLLPVYDKPMIYYPLSTLMLAGIREIQIISTPQDLPRVKELMGDGSALGIELTYAEQPKAEGLAQAFLIGEEFIGADPCCLILGDNIYYGNRLTAMLREAAARAVAGRATIFGYYVKDPKRYGIVEFDETGKVVGVEEKPENPKSNYAITGLYFYPCGVCGKASRIKPSARGELEITDLNDMYLKEGLLDVELLGRGFAWFDAGTIESLAAASDFVRAIERCQSVQISVPEEIAYRNGWIDEPQLLHFAGVYGNSPYGEHLRMTCEDRIYSKAKKEGCE